MDCPARLNPAESRALTGLRGCGAALVVLHHSYLHLNSGPALDPLLRRGYLGVDLFFVLSGFVLSLAYGAWFDPAHARVKTVSTFLIRRIARIWPLHAAVLLILLALGWLAPSDGETVHTLISNLTMTQAWGFSRSLNAPTWSISTEFLAYLLFPFLAALLLHNRSGPLLGLAAMTLLLSIALHAAPPLSGTRRGWLDIYFNYSPLPVARCFAGVILGMLTWRAGHIPKLQCLLTNPWTGPATLLLALLLMLTGVNDLVIYLLLPLIILGMHFGTGPLVSILARGPVHAVGVLSYAIYLIHFELLHHFPFNGAPAVFALPAFFALLLVLASLAYYLIERPARTLIRRIAEPPLRSQSLPHPCSGPRHSLFRLYSIFRR